MKRNDQGYLVGHWGDAASGHVGAPHGFDFLHSLKFLIIEDLVEVDYNLVEEPDALHPLVDVLAVKLGEVWNRGKQDSSVAPPLSEEVLHPPLSSQVKVSNVARKKILH